MLVAVEGLALPLAVFTGADDERVMVLLGVKTLDARSFICEKTPSLDVAGVRRPNFDVGGVTVLG
jgi:hypothetical protein